MKINYRLQVLKKEIENTMKLAKRNLNEILLIAVSKTKPESDIIEATNAGHNVFGENKVQEGILKISNLKYLEHLEWHLIGHLQKNKAKSCPGLFKWIHSIDSIDLSKKLHQACLNKKKTLNILLQMNLSKEKSKFGIMDWDKLIKIAEYIENSDYLNLRGLMTIPPINFGEVKTRRIFSELRKYNVKLKEQLKQPKIDQLSMGMSSDYKWAIYEGSTMIRIGTTIFGSRV